MSVTTKATENGTGLIITIDGRFDFGMQNEFRHAYEGTTASEYIVDMRGTDYMDSSALGMLLMIREHAGGNSASITIENCTEDIKTILSVANFQSLFKIT